jgi:hypothetical protein
MSKIEIGDRITFKSNTRHGSPTLTRVVKGFWGEDGDQPSVRAHGWTDFMVYSHEVISVIKKVQP